MIFHLTFFVDEFWVKKFQGFYGSCLALNVPQCTNKNLFGHVVYCNFNENRDIISST
jgi:hypothetical protein